jgi:hypothetical protein
LPSHDHAHRRQSFRSGREKGAWVYIPEVELAKAGYADEEPPLYRTWAGPRGRVVLQLYRNDRPAARGDENGYPDNAVEIPALATEGNE